MLFNSIPFLIFLPVVFILYWFLFKRNKNGQNALLLLASYVFYGWWDYRFLILIGASTLIDFFLGLFLGSSSSSKWRKFFLWCSIVFNLSLLAIFKYFNFFIENWMEVGKTLGLNMHLETLQIILPVGISFYTFQTLSYTIDVYKNKIKPTSDVVKFATYVAFFPQLVAGPIERAANFLPQFSKLRIFNFEFAKSGVHLILWGFFQKMVIADNCATYVNAIFNNYQNVNSLTLILGMIYFSFQIYGDFAGYSNIARGTARLFGFELMRNFNYPYFSRNIAEFWRRWHISLSTWFRDYLYIPLGGSRVSPLRNIRNVLIVFLVSGFWHGASWTFIIWGALHGLFFIPLLLTKSNRKYLDNVSNDRKFPNLQELMHIIATFLLSCIAWVFFRSKSISDAFRYLNLMWENFDFELEYLTIERYNFEMLLLIGLFVIVEWISKNKEHPITGSSQFLKSSIVILAILLFGVFSNHSEFIYFQF